MINNFIGELKLCKEELQKWEAEQKPPSKKRQETAVAFETKMHSNKTKRTKNYIRK